MGKTRNILRKIQGIVLAIGIIFIILGSAYLVFQSTEPKDLTRSEDDYLEIYTASDYRKYWDLVRNGNPFVNGRLMADIYLNDLEDYNNWASQPPENKSSAVGDFQGSFDGNGHTIYGLYSENGYGLVERNRGEIFDVTIKKSLIIGNRYAGGICYFNKSVIRECRFYGETKSNRVSVDSRCKMAGISVINIGSIEKCGYKGTMSVRLKWIRSGQRAGICIQNEGEIVSCYNLVPEIEVKGGNCYAIADKGEENCYMIMDSNWQVSDDSQVKALDENGMQIISAYLNKDLYTLYQNRGGGKGLFLQPEKASQKSAFVSFDGEDNERQPAFSELLTKDRWTEEYMIKNALQDDFFGSFIFEEILHQGLKFDDLSIKGMANNADGVNFDVLTGFREERFRFASYTLESDINLISSNNAYQKLWEYCSTILGGKSSDSWQHDTWLMMEKEEEKADKGVMILYSEAENHGFFYIIGGNLYRIEYDGKMNDSDFQSIKTQIEELAFAAEDLEETEDAEYLDEDRNEEEGAEESSGSPWETMLWKLWEGRIPSDGFVWKDQNIKEAVYSNAAIFASSDTEGKILSREELSKVEMLEIEDISKIETLEDLAKLQSLKSLSIDKAQIKNAGSIGQMTQLEELYLTNCDLKDISFAANLTGLKKASFYGNEIQNIEALSHCKELEELSLGYCGVQDISPLASAVKLKELGLQGNEISDIKALGNLKNLTGLNLMSNEIEDLSPLEGMTQLTALGLADNRISDISCLKGMDRLYNLALDVNEIQDISVLESMTELEWLGLSGNQIRDFTPIEGLENLFYLSVYNNPSQDIGGLVLTPDLRIGIDIYNDPENERQAAQKLLDQVVSGGMVLTEDIAKGDLNGDGIEDIAVTGCTGQEKDESGSITDWGQRAVYVFLGSKDGDYTLIKKIDTRNPDEGGIYGDPYEGITISGNHLLISNYGGSNFRWEEKDIFEYKDQDLMSKYELSLEYWLWNPDGYDWLVYDAEKKCTRKYAVAGPQERHVEKLLIWDEQQQEQQSRMEKEIDDKVLALEEEKGIELPEISRYFYEPDIDGDGYYFYEVHEELYNTRKKPEEILKMADDIYMEETQELPVSNYTSEEIKENYDKLAGVELPEMFYLGFDGETPQMLSYRECRKDGEDGYVHVMEIKEPTKDNEWWLEEKTIYYYEKGEYFEVK